MYTARDISAGEELSNCYISDSRGEQARAGLAALGPNARGRMLCQYLFTCECALCMEQRASGHFPSDSDSEISSSSVSAESDEEDDNEGNVLVVDNGGPEPEPSAQQQQEQQQQEQHREQQQEEEMKAGQEVKQETEQEEQEEEDWKDEEFAEEDTEWGAPFMGTYLPTVSPSHQQYQPQHTTDL